MHSQASGKMALLAAVSSFSIVAALVLIAGAAVPEYSHLSQFISELGARNAPYEWPVRMLGFLPAGILLLAFCYFAHSALPRSKATTIGLLGFAVFAAGYLIAAAFPCDFGCRPKQPSSSQVIHNVGGLAGYLVAPVFLFILAHSARKWPAARAVSFSGYAASAVALIGVVTLDPSSSVAGLSQRILEAAVLGWAVVCGFYISKRSPSAA
jgi:hypothetical protein